MALSSLPRLRIPARTPSLFIIGTMAINFACGIGPVSRCVSIPVGLTRAQPKIYAGRGLRPEKSVKTVRCQVSGGIPPREGIERQGCCTSRCSRDEKRGTRKRHTCLDPPRTRAARWPASPREKLPFIRHFRTDLSARETRHRYLRVRAPGIRSLKSSLGHCPPARMPRPVTSLFR